MKNLKLSLLALLTCISTSALADDSFSVHGYGIVAGDFDKDPINLSLHRDPNGDPRGKLGTLGNGYWHDYFATFTLNKKWEGKNGQWADYNYEFIGYGDKTMESGQNYARFGGLSFMPEGSSIWGGRKIIGKIEPVFGYALKDVGIDTGFGYSSKNFDISVGTDQATYSGSTMLEGSRNIVDIAYRVGKAEFGATWVKEMENVSNSKNENQTSLSLSGEYNTNKFLEILPGNTSYKLQVGKGIIAQYLNANRITLFSNKNDKAIRATISGKIQEGEKWVINSALIYEKTDRDGERTDGAKYGFNHGSNDEIGIFAGINATQKITDNISIVYEANLNNTKNKNGTTEDGKAYKISAGPALQLEVNEWVRPIMRLNAAYVSGDKAITELNKDSEVRVGYSMEAWF